MENAIYTLNHICLPIEVICLCCELHCGQCFLSLEPRRPTFRSAVPVNYLSSNRWLSLTSLPPCWGTEEKRKNIFMWLKTIYTHFYCKIFILFLSFFFFFRVLGGFAKAKKQCPQEMPDNIDLVFIDYIGLRELSVKIGTLLPQFKWVKQYTALADPAVGTVGELEFCLEKLFGKGHWIYVSFSSKQYSMTGRKVNEEFCLGFCDLQYDKIITFNMRQILLH